MKLTQEQKDKLVEEYKKFFFSCEEFSKFYLMDDKENNFAVPTRQHMVIDGIPKFQKDIFNHLGYIKANKRIALASPRSFMKSTTCSVEFPLWATCFKHFREILLVSNSESLAVNFLRSIRINLESNERILRYFGKLWSDKWTESHIITTEGVSVRAVGWGAQIRGFRPDLIIMDDIESDETVNSEDSRKKMKEWILKAAINSLRVDGSMIWVGTLINRVSLLHDWINNPPMGWKTIFNQAYIGGVQEKGRELWPEVWPHERLQQRKAEIGSAAFSSEFMNDPLPPEGNSFNPDTFMYFNEEDVPKDYGVYIAIDPAFSESPTADFGVIMVCLHDATNDRLYVHSYYRQRTNSRKIIDEFERIYRIYSQRVRSVGIEEIGPQKSFYQQLVSEINQKGLYPPFQKLTGMIQTARGTAHKKEQRIIYSLQPRFEARKIYMRHEMVDLIEELTLFSESGNKHDDLCLVGETKVLTNTGNKLIKNIQVGDMVLTRSGFKKVIWSGMTGFKKVIRNIGITGTPNHPIITKSGIKNLEYVKESDILYIWNEKLSCIEEKNITDILLQKEGSTGLIFGDMISGISRHLLCTVKYGLITLAIFLLKCISTIKTETHLIMNYVTLKLFPIPSMPVSIQAQKRELLFQETVSNLQSKKLQNGIEAKKGFYGIENMLRIQSLEKKKKGFASNVTHHTKQELNSKQNFAEVNVGQDFTEDSTEQDLNPVYNLLVEDSHEFFANNILVHNCDSLSYITHMVQPFQDYSDQGSFSFENEVYNDHNITGYYPDAKEAFEEVYTRY